MALPPNRGHAPPPPTASSSHAGCRTFGETLPRRPPYPRPPSPMHSHVRAATQSQRGESIGVIPALPPHLHSVAFHAKECHRPPNECPRGAPIPSMSRRDRPLPPPTRGAPDWMADGSPRRQADLHHPI